MENKTIAGMIEIGMGRLSAKKAAKEQAERVKEAALEALWQEFTASVSAALPEALRGYLSSPRDWAEYPFSEPPKLKSGNCVSVRLEIPGLAPIVVELINTEDGVKIMDRTLIPRSGTVRWGYSVPRVNRWDGEPEWTWRGGESTDDVHVALALAHQAQIEYCEAQRKWVETMAREQQEQQEEQETRYVPVEEDGGGLMGELVGLIRDVVREQLSQ